MQAMVWALDHLDTCLRGRRQFIVFTDHKPLETQSKHQDKPINRLTEAFLKYNFVIQYKKGSEMPTDFLSRNAIDALGIFSDNWKLKQELDEFVKDTHRDAMTVHERKNKTNERKISLYWWPGLDSEIEIHINSCDICQRTRKFSRGSAMFESPLPQCSEPNQKIHMICSDL
jgi:hypothetical protein